MKALLFNANQSQLCSPENIAPVHDLINNYINEDTTYAKQPLELRNQRNYAVRSGVNGLLDVARTTYKESMEDAYQHATELSGKILVNLGIEWNLISCYRGI